MSVLLSLSDIVIVSDVHNMDVAYACSRHVLGLCPDCTVVRRHRSRVLLQVAVDHGVTMRMTWWIASCCCRGGARLEEQLAWFFNRRPH